MSFRLATRISGATQTRRASDGFAVTTDSSIWCNEKTLTILRSPQPYARSGRPFLVFIVPDASAPSSLNAILSKPRCFDIAVRFYGEPGENRALLDHADFVMTGGLSKLHAAALFLEQQDLFETYAGYLFLDGDLEFDAGQLGHFLQIAHAAGLDLAQPSLTRDSHDYWNVVFHQPHFLLRETSFVEVMCPYFSRRALSLVRKTFTRSISTYGLDFVWPRLLPHGRIGVVDAFQVRHRSVVDWETGPFYRYLRTIGVNPKAEEDSILAEHGVRRHQPHSHRGYVVKRSGSHGRRPQVRSVPLLGLERVNARQSIIDLAFRLASRLAMRNEPYIARRITPLLQNSPETS